MNPLSESERDRGLCRVAVLASGRGSNLQAVLDAAASPDYPAKIAVVISNHSAAFALERARHAGVATRVLTRKASGGLEGQDAAIVACLAEFRIDLVVTAGYDRILGPATLAAYSGRIVNIHPSLLPAFGQTLHAQQQALDYGVRVTGCTTHFVTDDLDAGPIILQKAVPVFDEDTIESLSSRILAAEHEILPETVRLFAEGRLRISGRRVSISPVTNPAQIT
jgi:phosphoribosylglycinamide formyltransferase 1